MSTPPPSNGPRRRDLLKLTAGLLLVACAEDDDAPANAEGTDAEGPDAEADATADPPDARTTPPDDAAFPYGVQAGSAEATQAIFWSYAAATPRAVLRVWPDADFLRGPPLIEATVEARDGFLKHTAEGLRPGELHRYAFFDDTTGVRSVEGRIRAAFAPGARGVLRLGATACTSANRAPFTPLPRMAERSLDALCHLGDFSYNDGSTTVETYRADWARMLANPEYRALLPTVGSYITWDDHELVDAAAEATATPEQIDAAKRVFFESVPVPERAERRFWASYRWGETAEVFVLDVRHERTPDHIASEAQLQWLLTALSESPCVFKVIMTSVPMADLPPLWGAAAESWMHFVADRDRVLDHIVAEGIRGVVFLSGDFHVGAVWRVEDTGPRAGMYEILCGPGGSADSKRMALARASQGAWNSFFPEGRIDFATEKWCATYITLDAEAETIRVELVEGDTGAVLHDATLPRA
jgi:phosphodiesterase/alkaline phosphatase D-like protein